MLRKIYDGYLRPMLGRPPQFQVAALCYRKAERGPEILLISSRDTGRWILPKGWPKQGLDAAGAALEEAWEEAGVKPARSTPREIGGYEYQKRLEGDLPVRTSVKVFGIPVARLSDSFPEAHERTRRWASVEEAVEAVDEPSLKTLLSHLPPQIAA